MDIQNSTTALLGGTKTAAPKTPDPTSAEGNVGAAVDSFSEVMEGGEVTAKAAMIGKADPHALVQALAQTELAVEAAVTVRDKVVEAYQEILRMPV